MSSGLVRLSSLALAIATALTLTAAPARADVGVGLFVGEPTGLDVKLGLSRRTALDLLFGAYSRWDNLNDGAYAHATYLVTPMVSRGRSVLVPLRLGVGVALFDDAGRFDNDLHVAARFPLEIALVFRKTPIELYGELALKITVIDPGPDHPTVDLDGGLGLRFYF